MLFIYISVRDAHKHPATADPRIKRLKIRVTEQVFLIKPQKLAISTEALLRLGKALDLFSQRGRLAGGEKREREDSPNQQTRLHLIPLLGTQFFPHTQHVYASS